MEQQQEKHINHQVIVVASPRPGVADELAGRLRRNGDVVYPTHSFQGCLRVATSVAPDMIVVEGEVPGRIEQLLHAHPVSRQARILRVSQANPTLLSTAAPRRAA